MPTTIAPQRATIEDLYRVEGNAEIVNGEIVPLMPVGDVPSSGGGELFFSLRLYVERTRYGRAYTDGVGFRVNLPNRESFSPDAAFYTGPRTGMKFLNGAPDFAVEVRSEHDYSLKAEREIEAKIADYFLAGTQVVWYVDLLGADVVKKYTPETVDAPVVFRRGDTADAEPAVPGWTFEVNNLFL